MTSYRIGQIVRGKYRIERVLGQGGMGVVVAARHLALDQPVAIKFLLPQMLENAELVARFAREARAASRIQSDHIARVIDVDTLEDGAPFIVMEYLEGKDLTGVRKSRRPLPTHLAAAYVIEACEAIGEAHALGIVHRDIKPANLFLAQRAGGRTRIKVLDFGISKMDAPGSLESVTRSCVVIGSAEYMSPEQMLSTRDVDGRTDIWSLGVTLYEITTGKLPFPGETLTQVCALVVSQPAEPPSCHAPGISPAFDAVVLRCLQKDRARRFASAGELAAALWPFVAWERASSTSWPSPQEGPGGGTVSLDQAPFSSASNASDREPRPSPSADWPAPPSIRSSPGTHAGVIGDAPSSFRPPSRAPIAGAALGIVASIAAAAFFLLRAPPPIAEARFADAGASSESAPAPEDAAAPSAPPKDEPPAEATRASASAPVAAPPPSSKPKPRSQPASPKACSPPFVVDANGMKHAKPECL